jgi:2-dehydro-3-deoxygluconokinase
MKEIITFGEIMGRLSPVDHLRLRQALPGNLYISFAGAEANVAASIALLGGKVSFVSALPDNVIADACVSTLQGLAVGIRDIMRTQDGRLGLYFLETGANQKPSQVIYDREGSSIAITAADKYNWSSIFKEAVWFHTTGITPAISKRAALAVQTAVKEAKANHLTVSFDLNFRKKLWLWDKSITQHELAAKTIRDILPYVDIVIANEEDAKDVLNIQAKDTDVSSGKLSVNKYPQVAEEIISQFGNISKVAITLRESISASHNNWGAMLYDAKQGKVFFSPTRDDRYEPYAIKNIVDRVGAGDSFAAGLIFALTSTELSDTQTALDFATAASCLAHSVPGDFNYSTRKEVESLMYGSGVGRVVR